MIVTNNAVRAEKLRCLRAHGSKPKYHHKVIGGNFRLDTLQAAVVQVKLRHLDDWTAGRQKNASRYERLFREAGISAILPAVCTDRHVFNQYVIRVPHRDELQRYLKEQGIGTEVYYPVPMHLQECFSYLGYRRGAFPNSERAAQETLAIPIYPELSDAQAEYVVDRVGAFLQHREIEPELALHELDLSACN
jgi:dTDP-4-amino-4,6-dideoxygalactose transaminase